MLARRKVVIIEYDYSNYNTVNSNEIKINLKIRKQLLTNLA